MSLHPQYDADLIAREKDETIAHLTAQVETLTKERDAAKAETKTAKTLLEAEQWSRANVKAVIVKDLEAEVAALTKERDEARAERDHISNYSDTLFHRAVDAEARVMELRTAITTFLLAANQAPKRNIGSGIGGMTIEANLKATGRLISEWEISQLEEAIL